MRVLLINPPNLKGFLVHSTMPLGLAYIAAAVRPRHEPLCLDLNVERLDFTRLRRRIEDFDPQMIGLTTVTPTFPYCVALARRLKETFPSLLITLGGHHVTAIKDIALQEDAIDFIVMGEGETAFAHLLSALEDGTPLADVPALGFRDDAGKIVVNPPAPSLADLDDLFLPAWDALPMHAYRGRFRPALSMVCSRGCPYTCIYCSAHLTHGRQVRKRSIDSALEELDILINQYGAGYLLFYDDNFTIDRNYTMALCEAMVREKLTVDFWCYTRVNLVDPELLRALKRAGCIRLAFGFESGVDRLLYQIRKGTSVEEAVRATAWTRQAGIVPEGYFIINFPFETHDESRQTVRFALQLNIPYFYVLTAVPYPGTAMLEQCIEHGLIDEAKREDYGNQWFHTDLVIRNPGNPHGPLRQLQQRTALRMWTRPETLFDAFRFIFRGASPRFQDLRFFADKTIRAAMRLTSFLPWRKLI